MTQETTPEVKGFGAMLREARESLGISIGDVSSRTRLSVDQIRAIEEENLERLPEPVYVRAFLRAYAKAIDIDYEPLVNDYVTRCGGGGVRIPEHAPEEAFREVAYYDSPRPSRWKFAGLLVLIVVVTLGIWGVYSGTFARLMEADGTEAAKVENGVSEVAPNVAPAPEAPKTTAPVEVADASKPAAPAAPAAQTAPGPEAAPASETASQTTSPAAPAETPAPVTEAPAAPAAPVEAPAAATEAAAQTTEAAPAETYAAEFHTSASCWVHVIAPDGQNLIAREMKPGETQSVALPAGTRVTVGNPPALILTLDGHPYDLGGVTQRGVARFVIH